MDWDQIKIPSVEVKQRRPQSGALSQLDYAKLVVMGKLIEKSTAAMLQTAVLTYIQRNWTAHEERLIVEANSRGVTPEELFTELAAQKPDRS